MALLQNMRQQDPDAQQDMTGMNDPDARGDAMGGRANPDAMGDRQRGGGGQLEQVVAGMMNKLFPDQSLQALIDMLKQQQGQGIATVVNSIVGGVIGLLKQGKQQGKTLPIKVVMGALLPILGKIAQGVEQDEQRGAALFSELIGKVGQQLAQQGGKAGVLDQQQAQELMGMVQQFAQKVAQHFGGQQQQPQGQPQQQPQPAMQQ